MANSVFYIQKSSLSDMRSLAPVLLFMFLILIILVFLIFYTKSYVLYFIFNVILTIFLIKLSMSRHNALVIFGVMLLFSSFYLLWVVTIAIPTVPMWDYKAQVNVAEYIINNGRIPTAPLGGVYRPEYISYPLAFTEYAILSQISNIAIDMVYQLPLGSVAFLIIFLLIISDIKKSIKGNISILLISLLLTIVVFYNFYLFFIYQNYGRTLLVFLLYLILRILIGGFSDYRKMVVIVTLLIIAVVYIHSESSIALFLAGLGLGFTAFVEKSQTNRQVIRVLTSIIIMVFISYYIYCIPYFGFDLINMMRATINFLLSPEVTERSIAKYTPLDYTWSELVLYVTSLIMILLMSLITFILGIYIYIKRKVILKFFISLIIIGLAFLILFLFSPYKSDISFKLITVLVAITSFSLYETTSYRNPLDRMHKIFVFLIVFIIYFGIFLRINFTYFSEINLYYYNFAYLLSHSKISMFIPKNSSLVILDTPGLPYYFTRDYINPRALEFEYIKYQILVVDPNVSYYKYKLINGLKYPRFILYANPSLLTSNNSLFNSDIIIADPLSLTKFDILFYNNGFIGLSKVHS
jgi:hypothetical protein